MSIEAMKQALEALEANDVLINGSGTHGGLVFAMDGYYSGCFDIDGTNEKTEQAIKALRQAIEQAEKRKPSLWLAIGKDGRVKYTTDSDRAINWKQSGSHRLVRDYYTAPVHASDISQERVDETAKDRHEWVGLTEIEICDIEADELTSASSETFSFARAIEAKLKERNT